MPERNTDLFHAIAERIATEPECYDQTGYAKEAPTMCGTVGCIAGHAVHVIDHGLWGDYLTNRANGDDIERTARRALGLTYHEASILFCESWRPPEDMTVPEALKLLANGAHLTEVTGPGHYEQV